MLWTNETMIVSYDKFLSVSTFQVLTMTTLVLAHRRSDRLVSPLFSSSADTTFFLPCRTNERLGRTDCLLAVQLSFSSVRGMFY